MLCTPFATAVFGESKCVNIRTCLHNVSPDNKNALASRLREALTRRGPKAAGMMYDSPECAHYPLSLSTFARNRCLNTHTVVRVGIASTERAASSLADARNKRFHLLYKVLSVLAQSVRVVRMFDQSCSRALLPGTTRHSAVCAGGRSRRQTSWPACRAADQSTATSAAPCARPWLRPELGSTC